MIRNATVVDGTGAAPAPATTVVVDHGRIAWIGPDESARSFGEPTVVEAAGASLLPGLINAHVHLANDGAADFAGQITADSATTAAVRALANAQASLDYGITTVRDCGAANGTAIDVAAAIADGLAEGPRVVAAGRVLTMTGGHSHYMGVEVDGTDQARRAVRREVSLGAGFIKVIATGGVLTPGRHPAQIALHEDELSWIVREAHAAGRRVAAHAIGREGIANALAAGVDSLEHGFYLDEELMEIAIEQGTFLVPTLVALEGILDPDGTPPDRVVEKALEQRDRARGMFRSAVAAGVRVALGTDAGTPHNPHTMVAREMRGMAALGLPHLAVVRAATLAAAQNLDLHNEIGSIEVGKIADLVLFPGRVSEDFSGLDTPLLVARDGRILRQ